MRTTSRDGTFYGCRLTRGSLEEIIRTLARDATDQARLTISAEQEINRFEAGSLADFITELDEPDQLDNLSIWLTDSDRRVNIRLSAVLGSVSLSVSGASETWVRGRYDELAHRLGRTRGALAYSPSVATWVLSSIWLTASLVLGRAASSKQALVSGYLGVGAVMLMLWMLLHRRRKSMVQLGEAQSAWSGMTVFNVAVAVVSVLLAVASLLVGWAAWQHPVK